MSMVMPRPRPQGSSRRSPRTRQRGVAIISALVVVALAAMLVAGMLWRQSVQVRRIENQRLIEQAQWVARGGTDWTRLILRSEGDTMPGVTYLGGIWAVPLARTRLSDLIGKGAPGSAEAADTYFSGSVEDAQSRFNLRSLVVPYGNGQLQISATQLASFARLLAIVGVDTGLAKPIAQQVRASLRNSATRFQAGAPGSMPIPAGGTSGTSDAGPGGGPDGDPLDGDSGPGGDSGGPLGPAPIVMTSVDSLLDVPGVTPDVVTRLRPFVDILPTAAPVNMNTASPEVVAALTPGMSLAQAQAFVARRATIFFRNTGDVQLALEGAGVREVTIDTSQIDVTTNYFVVRGHIEYGRASVDRSTLVYRDPLTHTTRVVRTVDLS
jgi:general secretion pathway protein K